MSMSKKEVMGHTISSVNKRNTCENDEPNIQGSVDESPSAERVLSLHLPGANMPCPYPSTETHHGSFKVILREPF